jgi:SulP family sulfate permease
MYALLICGLVVAVMLFWPEKWRAVFPPSLAGLIIAFGVSAYFDFPVETIGNIPKTLIADEHLNFASIHLGELKNLIVPAVSIAALGMIESLLCGEVAAKMKNEKYDANRDLVAQGIGNMVIPLFGGIPATAAIARTSVGIKSGGQTRLVSIFHSIGLVMSMFLLAPVMSQIPVSALSGVLIMTAVRMNDWASIRYIFSHRFKGAILKYVVTLAATVVFDLTEAIVIGVVIALLLLVRSVSQTQMTTEKVDPTRFFEKAGVHLEHTEKNVCVSYFVGPMFFVSMSQIREQLSEIDNIDVLILSMRGVSHIDISGTRAISELHDRFEKAGARLLICGLQPQVEDMFKRSNILETIGESSVFWSAEQAILSAWEA